jgi:integrase
VVKSSRIAAWGQPGPGSISSEPTSTWAKEKRFLALFKGRLAADITSKDVEDFKAAFAQDPVRRVPGKRKRPGRSRSRSTKETARAVATVNAYLKYLKAVFSRAVRQGRLGYNPVHAVKLYRENNARNRCLSAEEESRLLSALSPRLRALVTMVLHTGMRRGELRALRWDDIDFATGTLRIRQDKAGDGRWVTLNSVAKATLLGLRREQRILGPYVFCSPLGKFLHNWEREWRPALEAAQIPDFRFHDCRHTFASRLTMAGVDLYTVQRAGGWKTQVMVQRYAHLSPDHMKAAVERLATVLPDGGTGTKTGTSEAVASAGGSVSVRKRMVSRPGIEPGTPCLKGRSSAN